MDWGALYARLMTSCGYTPDEIDAMAMIDVLALLRYWHDAPPTHEILAAVYKITRPRPQAQSHDDPSGIGSLMARFPDGAIKST